MWKDIKNYEGIYQCSDKGEIRSCKTFKTLKYRYDKDGYGKVILYNKGKGVEFRVHRLIAETFIPNPNKLPLINHKKTIIVQKIQSGALMNIIIIMEIGIIIFIRAN